MSLWVCLCILAIMGCLGFILYLLNDTVNYFIRLFQQEKNDDPLVIGKDIVIPPVVPMGDGKDGGDWPENRNVVFRDKDLLK